MESSVVFSFNGPLGEERIAIHPSFSNFGSHRAMAKMSNLGEKTRQKWNLTEGFKYLRIRYHPKKLTAGRRGLDQWFPLWKKGVYVFQAGTRRAFSGGLTRSLLKRSTWNIG